MILNYILKNINEYRRLKIELDLIESKLSDKHPTIKLVIKHLKTPPYNIHNLIKELEEDGRI